MKDLKKKIMTDTRVIENALFAIADRLKEINTNLAKMNDFIEAYDVSNPKFQDTMKALVTTVAELQETL